LECGGSTPLDLGLECGGSTPLSARRLDAAGPQAIGSTVFFANFGAITKTASSRRAESGVEPPHSKTSA
jgi:hypothetical protein